MYRVGQGEKKPVAEHLPDIPLTNVFEMRMRLEDIDLLEENGRESSNNHTEDLPKPLKLLG